MESNLQVCARGYSSEVASLPCFHSLSPRAENGLLCLTLGFHLFVVDPAVFSCLKEICKDRRPLSCLEYLGTPWLVISLSFQSSLSSGVNTDYLRWAQGQERQYFAR